MVPDTGQHHPRSEPTRLLCLRRKPNQAFPGRPKENESHETERSTRWSTDWNGLVDAFGSGLVRLAVGCQRFHSLNPSTTRRTSARFFSKIAKVAMITAPLTMPATYQSQVQPKLNDA